MIRKTYHVIIGYLHLNETPAQKFARQVGKSIRRERLRRGMSEKELASQIGVSLYVFRRIESGETRIKYHTFFKAVRVLGVSEGKLAPSSRYNNITLSGFQSIPKRFSIIISSLRD